MDRQTALRNVYQLVVIAADPSRGTPEEVGILDGVDGMLATVYALPQYRGTGDPQGHREVTLDVLSVLHAPKGGQTLVICYGAKEGCPEDCEHRTPHAPTPIDEEGNCADVAVHCMYGGEVYHCVTAPAALDPAEPACGNNGNKWNRDGCEYGPGAVCIHCGESIPY